MDREQYLIPAVSVAPTFEAVNLGEVKAHLRLELDDTDEDAYLKMLIATAREWCQNYQGRTHPTTTWTLTLDEFPANDEPIILPMPPLASVSSITYYDSSNVLQTLSSSLYIVDTKREPGRVAVAWEQSWPDTADRVAAVTVTYVAGTTAVLVSPSVKHAMLLLIAHWHENREAVLTGTISKEMEFTVSALLEPERMRLVM